MSEKLKNELIRLFFLFLTGCLVGWIYEVTLGFIYGYGFVNRGFLFGPYLPIYGVGLILLDLSLSKLMKKPIRVFGIKINPILVFLGIMVITTALEYVVGYVLLRFYDLRLWDYSKYWMNYQGIISFKTSFRFGIGGMVLLYILVPLADRIRNALGMKAREVIAISVLTVMLIDFIATILIK